MKLITLLLTLVLTTGAFAFGETTGHFMTPFNKIQVFITQSERINKSEIEGATFKAEPKVLGNLESFRVHGQYMVKEDILKIVLEQSR